MTHPVSPCCGADNGSYALTFPAILQDPMIRDLMEADHVDSRTLTTDLARIAASIGAKPQNAHMKSSPCSQ